MPNSGIESNNKLPDVIESQESITEQVTTFPYKQAYKAVALMLLRQAISSAHVANTRVVRGWKYLLTLENIVTRQVNSECQCSLMQWKGKWLCFIWCVNCARLQGFNNLPAADLSTPKYPWY